METLNIQELLSTKTRFNGEKVQHLNIIAFIFWQTCITRLRIIFCTNCKFLFEYQINYASIKPFDNAS